MFDQYNTAEEAPPLVPPAAYPLEDDCDDDEKFEIACVCNKNSADVSLVQCEKCNFWFHKACIFIPREPTGEYSNFYCPFCLQQKLRCKCGDCSKYNEEMIMCPKCHFYVHKKCEVTDDLNDLKKFVCSHCSNKNANENDDGMIL